MRPNLFIGLCTAAMVAGCTTSSQTSSTRAGASDARARAADDRDTGPTHRTSDSIATRPPRTSGAPATLPAYEVRESAFSDFGMSVKTNVEVRWGGRIEWMFVTGVSAGSSAARMGVAPGDQILAIDGREITAMDRDVMLEAFFQRKKGERSRLLVLGRRESLPRFLNVFANRPGS